MPLNHMPLNRMQLNRVPPDPRSTDRGTVAVVPILATILNFQGAPVTFDGAVYAAIPADAPNGTEILTGKLTSTGDEPA